MSELSRSDPLRDISGRLWEVERKLHLAERKVLKAMGNVQLAPDANAERAHTLGFALGSAKVHITEAIENIHEIQELIRPTLG